MTSRWNCISFQSTLDNIPSDSPTHYSFRSGLLFVYCCKKGCFAVDLCGHRGIKTTATSSCCTYWLSVCFSAQNVRPNACQHQLPRHHLQHPSVGPPVRHYNDRINVPRRDAGRLCSAIATPPKSLNPFAAMIPLQTTLLLILCSLTITSFLFVPTTITLHWYGGASAVLPLPVTAMPIYKCWNEFFRVFYRASWLLSNL